ncbi:MAG TPA: F0F1 ATP synthase subunit A, partial [Actinomycetota bacterium]|nr:F0F1 ATP synthase subunit A [Actinomycetota bacterium]
MTATALPLAREGFHAPSIEEFEWPSIVDIHLFGIDLSINRVVLQMFLVVLVVWGLFFFAFRRPKLVPSGLQNVMETLVDFVRNQIALEVIGHDGLRFVPYLTTLFAFVFLGNVGGIIPPVFFPLNGRMALPAVMAICSLLLFISVGISQQGFGTYFRNTLFPPGMPWPIYILLTPIELISTFIVRPVTLAIRLLANMIAGHLILSVFFVAAGYMLTSANISTVFGVGALIFAVALIAFELFVAGLQAYVFT